MDWKLELVVLPVADSDRSLAFYRDQIGFNVDHDQTVDENIRFVQMTPTGSACSIAFGRGLVPDDQGPIKTLQMVVTDIEAAHTRLKDAGVEVSDIADLAWGSFVYFSDPDGNAWAVQQGVPRTVSS
ncbi:MAG: VOC family protein [Acidimicrobiia bacterium]